MPYTEIKERGEKRYYYRVKSVRADGKVNKKRIYLGVNLDKKRLSDEEIKADKELVLLGNLLTKEEIKFLHNIKKNYLEESKTTLENRYESFASLFTYDSNAIEGNTLTLIETAQLLFEGRVPSSKSLREVNETLNHKKAFDYILNYKGDINKKLILELHQLIVKDTLKKELSSQIGKYRTDQVYIRGADWIPSKPEEIANEIKSLLKWYSINKDKLHPLVIATYFHIGFETIHPFIDGNGRVGRLLMNFILHKNKYPMINIPNSIKHKYYSALADAQIKGNLKTFLHLLLKILKKKQVVY